MRSGYQNNLVLHVFEKLLILIDMTIVILGLRRYPALQHGRGSDGKELKNLLMVRLFYILPPWTSW